MLKMRLRTVAIGALFALITGAAHPAQLITNGGFETGTFSSWNYDPATGRANVTEVTTYATCCFVTGAYPYGTWAAFFGANNEPGGAFSQNVTTLAGGAYTLSFAYGAISQGRPQRLMALVLDTAGLGPPSIVTSQLFDAHGTTDLATMMTSYNMFFNAPSTQTRVMFADAGMLFGISSTNVDGVLDNVSLTLIPEPSTYLLMIAGLGIVVFAARRRSKHGRPVATA